MRTLNLWKIVLAALVFGPMLLAVVPALIVPLVLYALCHTPNVINEMRRISKDPQAMNDRTRRALKWVALIVAGILIVSVFLYYLESSVIPRGNGEIWHFWFQIFTGNWSSPPKEYSQKPLTLALSIVVALVLNFISFGLFTWLLKRIKTVERIQAMKLEDALRFRDETIIGVIVHSFPEHEQERVRDTVRKAFKKASDVWVHDILPAIVTDAGKEEYVKRLHEETIGPKPG